jgi:hypothetical protein
VASVKAREGRDQDVLRQGHADVDDGRPRVDDGHAGELVALDDPALRLGTDAGELNAVVDLEGLGGVLERVGDNGLPVAAQDRQHIGEVELPLCVVGPDLGERREKGLAGEREDPGVDLGDPALLLARVAVGLRLDDPLDAAVGRPHDPAIAPRVIEHGGQDRRGGSGGGVVAVQPGDRARADQRQIAVQDDHRVAAGDQAGGCLDGVGCAARLFLDDDLDGLVEVIAERLRWCVDDDHARGAGLPRGRDRPGDHRRTADRVQELRRPGAHPRSLAGGEDHDDGFGHDERHPR